MTTRARELAARIMPYCQWLHDGTDWHLKPEAEAEIEAALIKAENAALERAANVIKKGQETFGSEGPNLSPRIDGNVAGLPYVIAIRALIGKPVSLEAEPDPTRALANFFVSIYLDYEARNYILANQPTLRLAMNLGLLTEHKAGIGFELTDPGRAALTLAKEPENA